VFFDKILKCFVKGRILDVLTALGGEGGRLTHDDAAVRVSE
jgi:hypothetical protein